MKITGENLTVEDVNRVAVHGETVEVDSQQMKKVKEAYDKIQEWGTQGHPIYGVNTGFGELIYMTVPAKYKTELQENLLRSHAAGGGEPFSEEVTRAIMLARLNCLSKGYSGASPETLHLLQTFLNRRIHPVIPQQGSLGASGDLAPLSHLALPLIGEGYVKKDGQVRSAKEVLEEEGLQAVQLGYKEALALVNGTSAMTGTAAIAVMRAEKMLKWALIGAADFIQCLRGSTRPFDSRGHELKNHQGQVEVAALLRQLLAGSHLVREHETIMQAIRDASAENEVIKTENYLQNAYTLRCIPQILGPVIEALAYSRRIVEEELNSCNDNPLIFDSPENVFHGGNFHGQYVAMACDFLNIAVAEIGVLAERQLNRLLDPYLNTDLPPFLAKGDAGLFCGFEGGQYLATSLASENLDLAAPASIKTIPSNGQNQDVVSMGLISARKTLRLTEHVGTMIAVLVAACHQASNFLGVDQFSPATRELHQTLHEIVPEYKDDSPMSDHIHRVRDYLVSKEGLQFADEQVKLADQRVAL
jgi:tyrosine 2,3-aminomutase